MEGWHTLLFLKAKANVDGFCNFTHVVDFRVVKTF